MNIQNCEDAGLCVARPHYVKDWFTFCDCKAKAIKVDIESSAPDM